MSAETIPLSPGAWLFIALYLASAIGVGWLAFRARRENTLGDFYLAGRGFGVLVLLMTLFATQYSGNTFFGFSGKTYRIGYAWIMSLHFMTAIVVCYLLFAPRLHRLARQRGFVTPPDYLAWRFGSPWLTLIGATVMILALSNYLLAQLMAMGRAMEGLAGGDPALAYGWGVGLLALIMVIYGTLGGMRAVAWTDAIQGAVMLAGFSIVFVMLFQRFGSLEAATRLVIASEDPARAAKAAVPDAARLREWLSYVLIVGIGAALYPQAIQRIYAARSLRTLRHSLMGMALLPLPTQLMAMVAGIMALAYLPGLEGAGSDAVFSHLLAEIHAASMLGRVLVVVLIAAVLAAMMSTADSALLSISSMLSNDVYRPWLRPAASQAELTRFSKRCSWALIGALVLLAIVLRQHTSLVALLDRKFDVLVQLAPAFILGLRWPRLAGGATLAGCVAGLIVALGLAFGPFEAVQGGKLHGIHPGLYGLAVNTTIAVAGSLRTRQPQAA